MTLHGTIYESISEIDAEEWDNLLGADEILKSHSYLSCVESSGILSSPDQYYYLVIRDEHKIVAHAVVYTVRQCLANFLPVRLQRIIKFIRRIKSTFLTIRLLECGVPLNLGSSITIAPDADQKKALQELQSLMDDLERKTKVDASVVRDFRERENWIVNSLQENRFSPIPGFPEAFVNLRWATFEEYLRDLRSDYRRRYNSACKRMKKFGISKQRIDNFGDRSKEIYELLMNTHRRAGEFQRETPTVEWIAALNDNLGSSSFAQVYQMDGKTIGVGLYVEGKSYLSLKMLGLDYSVSRQVGLYDYFLYDSIREGFELKKNKVGFGMTCIEEKQRVGADVEIRKMLFRYRGRLAHRFIVAALRRVLGAIPVKKKNIFKSQSPQSAMIELKSTTTQTVAQ